MTEEEEGGEGAGGSEGDRREEGGKGKGEEERMWGAQGGIDAHQLITNIIGYSSLAFPSHTHSYTHSGPHAPAVHLHTCLGSCRYTPSKAPLLFPRKAEHLSTWELASHLYL